MKDKNLESEEDEEMLDSADQKSFEVGSANVSMESANKIKSGRPKIPPQWSRIVMMEVGAE